MTKKTSFKDFRQPNRKAVRWNECPSSSSIWWSYWTRAPRTRQSPRNRLTRPTQIQWNYEVMTLSWIEKFRYLDYGEQIKKLIKKYGRVPCDYFIDKKYLTVNYKNFKYKDNCLYIHHIKEDRAQMLSQSEYVIQYDYNYQKAKNLVYCNLLEHLLLHITIAQKPLRTNNIDNKHIFGITGAFYISSKLNDIFAEYPASTNSEISEHKLLMPFENQYISIIGSFLAHIVTWDFLGQFHKFLENFSKRLKRKVKIEDLIHADHEKCENESYQYKLIKLRKKIILKTKFFLKTAIEDGANIDECFDIMSLFLQKREGAY